MYRLLYHSVARSAWSNDALQILLTESRRNNVAAGVTGLLVAGDERFMQVLEGPVDAVDATFARILRDPRHFALSDVVREPIATRTFAGWAMGYRRSGDGLFRGGPSGSVPALVASIRDPAVQSRFSAFATAL